MKKLGFFLAALLVLGAMPFASGVDNDARSRRDPTLMGDQDFFGSSREGPRCEAFDHRTRREAGSEFDHFDPASDRTLGWIFELRSERPLRAGWPVSAVNLEFDVRREAGTPVHITVDGTTVLRDTSCELADRMILAYTGEDAETLLEDLRVVVQYEENGAPSAIDYVDLDISYTPLDPAASCVVAPPPPGEPTGCRLDLAPGQWHLLGLNREARHCRLFMEDDDGRHRFRSIGDTVVPAGATTRAQCPAGYAGPVQLDGYQPT